MDRLLLGAHAAAPLHDWIFTMAEALGPERPQGRVEGEDGAPVQGASNVTHAQRHDGKRRDSGSVGVGSSLAGGSGLISTIIAKKPPGWPVASAPAMAWRAVHVPALELSLAIRA